MSVHKWESLFAYRSVEEHQRYKERVKAVRDELLARPGRGIREGRSPCRECGHRDLDACNALHADENPAALCRLVELVKEFGGNPDPFYLKGKPYLSLLDDDDAENCGCRWIKDKDIVRLLEDEGIRKPARSPPRLALSRWCRGYGCLEDAVRQRVVVLRKMTKREMTEMERTMVLWGEQMDEYCLRLRRLATWLMTETSPPPGSMMLTEDSDFERRWISLVVGHEMEQRTGGNSAARQVFYNYMKRINDQDRDPMPLDDVLTFRWQLGGRIVWRNNGNVRPDPETDLLGSVRPLPTPLYYSIDRRALFLLHSKYPHCEDIRE